MDNYYSESTRTEPVMQLILDRDEYDYDEYDADGKQLYIQDLHFIHDFTTKPFKIASLKEALQV